MRRSRAMSSSVNVRIARAGAPMMRELSGNSLPSVISAPAPTRQFLPIFAPFRMMDWMPINEPSPIEQPWIMA
jgi:hypothetical protein